jgi:hypothetical protein
VRILIPIFCAFFTSVAFADKSMPEGFNERLRESIYQSPLTITQLSTDLGFRPNKISEVFGGVERLPLFSVVHAGFLLKTNPVWLLLGVGDRSLSLDSEDAKSWSASEFESNWKMTMGGRLKFLLEKDNISSSALASELGLETAQVVIKTTSGRNALHALTFVKAINFLKADPYYLLALDLFDSKTKYLFACEKLLSKATDQEMVDELISRGWKVQLSR